MAIAFGGTSSTSHGGSGSYSYTSITVSGSDVYGLVGLETNSTSDTVTAVSWNGVNLTKLARRNRADGGGSLYVWGALGVGSGTISITDSGATGIGAYEIFYTGVNALDATVVANGSGTGISQNISFTPTTDNAWMLIWANAKDTGGAGIGAGTSTTKRTGNTDDHGWFDGNAAISPPASTTLQVTQTLSEAFAWIDFAIDPIGTAAGGTISRDFNLLGVGQ